MIVIENDEEELISKRMVDGWRVYIDYRKLYNTTRKDHFISPFVDPFVKESAKESEKLKPTEVWNLLGQPSGKYDILGRHSLCNNRKST